MLHYLMSDVPSSVQLLVYVLLGIGYALLVGVIGYNFFLRMAQYPSKEELAKADDAEQADGDADTAKVPELKMPPPWDLSSRLLTFASLAFIFLLAFMLNTFWGNVQDANTATYNEASTASRIAILAEKLDDPAQALAVQTGIAKYADMVVNVEWPYLEMADPIGASDVQIRASADLGDDFMVVGASGAKDSPIWPTLESSVNDLAQFGTDRIAEVPDASTPWQMTLVIVLGFVFIALVAAFLPTRKTIYFTSLAILGGLSALLVFIMVQSSNPYAQHIQPDGLVTLVSTLEGAQQK